MYSALSWKLGGTLVFDGFACKEKPFIDDILYTQILCTVHECTLVQKVGSKWWIKQSLFKLLEQGL